MINKIGLKNVRVFDTYYGFDLTPLSIFCGTNGSGKSTILKMFLLLRQSHGLYEAFGVRSGVLRFTGGQVDLGNYRTLVTDKREKRNMEIEINTDGLMPISVFSQLVQSRKLDLPIPKQRGVKYKLNINLKFGAYYVTTETEEAGKIRAIVPQGILQRATYEVKVGEIILAYWTIVLDKVDNGEVIYQIKFDKSIILKADSEIYRKSGAKSRKNLHYEVVLDGLLPVGVEAEEEAYDVPFVIRNVLRSFTNILKRIHYIAPLRAAAQRYYLASYDLAADLDPRGEFLPYILGGVIDEPWVIDVGPQMILEKERILSEALNAWLYYLRTGTKPNYGYTKNELEVATSEAALVELKLKSPRGSASHSIADSGFGYSQVIPIIVRGLLAPKGSVLIIEQPELHLNPALQIRLADFFISLVRAGKQVILETHSEHIVDAIRLRTAQDKMSELSRKTKIYYIDIKSGRADVSELSIQNDGTIPQWPKNFFGEAVYLSREILRAQKLHIVDSDK